MFVHHPLHIIPCSLLRLDLPGVQLLPATGVDFIIKGMEATRWIAEGFFAIRSSERNRSVGVQEGYEHQYMIQYLGFMAIVLHEFYLHQYL